MRLFVSVLLLAAASLATAQSTPASPNPSPQTPQAAPNSAGQGSSGQAADAIVARMLQEMASDQAMLKGVAADCPVELTAAAVSAPAGVLPVGAAPGGDGALNLHFRNRSGKEIRSASITAHLRIKTDVYALDASPVDLRLSFSGTKELGHAVDQLTRIALPPHFYLFGVVGVSLDQVTFADGSLWMAKEPGMCGVGGTGLDRLTYK